MICDRMKEVLELKGTTPIQCANDLDVPVGNVWRYLRGVRKPSNEFLFKFANCYGVDETWLLFGKSKTEKRSIVYLDDIEELSNFLVFLELEKEDNFSYLRGETNYCEPMLMKSYRVGVLRVSRKVMKKLMILGYIKLGYKM